MEPVNDDSSIARQKLLFSADQLQNHVVSTTYNYFHINEITFGNYMLTEKEKPISLFVDYLASD